MNNIFLYSLCIIPGLILLWYIYTKDKIEKEPLGLLIMLFIGGMIACINSILVSSSFKQWFSFLTYDYTDMNIFQIIFKILVTIVLIEEGSKWLISYIITWKNDNFNHIYDPIVYCTFVSLGFATLENIMYGLSLCSKGLMPIIIRGIVSVPCHAVFGIFMGYYLGIAKNALSGGKSTKVNKYKFLSFFIPVYLHFIYNILLAKSNLLLCFMFAVYIIVLYVIAINKIKKLSLSHKQISK